MTRELNRQPLPAEQLAAKYRRFMGDHARLARLATVSKKSRKEVFMTLTRYIKELTATPNEENS